MDLLLKSRFHEFIMQPPDGCETQIGEPAYNLDSLSEAVILKSLRDGAAGKTIALVSHRRSTVRIADEIIEM